MVSGQAVAQRRQWLQVLADSDASAIEERLARLSLPAPEVLREPATGLVMVRGRAGGRGRRFNLGEMTVTRCAVAHGGVIGYGYVRGRDRRKALLVARCDALLQLERHRAALLAEVVEPLAAILTERRGQAARRAAATRVEFFTMARGDE
jgi:alpha-D-ribose 1-methylphosphonate 5-triphosphate synthase subunit PhnG